MTAHSICPECGLRIDLEDLKDFESFSNKETFEHYEDKHPEKVLRDKDGRAFGMPYTPIRFE